MIGVRDQKRRDFLHTVTIRINTFPKARQFCSTVSRMDGEFDLVSKRYVVNAKSMLGIFSLDLSQPLQLNIYTDESKLDSVLKQLAPFLVEEHEGQK
jgi:phosphotransferase system HPr-like phosphotransfer protein